MTALILAGGQSRRMGRDKLKLTLSGEALLPRAVRRFAAVFDRVLVSVADPGCWPELGEQRVYDRYPGCGPLAGLHAGLLAAGEPVFLTGADMPFADPEKAAELMCRCGDHAACVLQDAEGRWEPLFGCYRPAVLEQAEAMLAAGRRSMGALLAAVDTLYLSPGALGWGAASRLLLNVNHPADYEKLRLELGE